MFECSAAGPALVSAFQCVKPRGTIVQVGVTGELSVPVNMLVGKEIIWRGSQRFHGEFAHAVKLIGARDIDVRPILSHTFPIDEALAAFLQAGDRTAACKVQIALS
ncbi:L-idonate 5-dehydrogenase (NAD(P)(+)) [compost metagenome]